MLVEYTGGSNATVSLHYKKNGVWSEVDSFSGYVGKNGIDKTKEGDKRTPTGTFNLTTPFGILDDPGSAQPYTKVNKYLYWCGASGSKYYNQLVDSREVSWTKSSADEHLIDYSGVYDYGMFIDYNARGEAGKGSAIFLHCTGSNGYTGGCVAIHKAKMKTVIQQAKAGTKIIITKKHDFEPKSPKDYTDGTEFEDCFDVYLTVAKGDTLILRDSALGSLPQLEYDIASYYVTADKNKVTAASTEDRCTLKANKTGETKVYIYNNTTRITLHLNITDMKTFALPSATEEIDEEAFEGIACRRLIIPEGLESCAADAFEGLSAIEQVAVPEGLSDAVMGALPRGGDVLWLCGGKKAVKYAKAIRQQYILIEQ